MEYIDFLKDKMAISAQRGFDINDSDITPSLYPHVKDTVRWAIKGGSRAIFSSFGMQKTVTQLEIERIIERYSNRGDVVFDPFGGIQSVPYTAIRLGRQALSTELNYDYWRDGLTYLREAEQQVKSPTLFDFMTQVG